MQNPEQFDFERTRGIVWVCDIAGSSRHLNDNASVDAVEEFLPRFHWVARLVVRAADGQFIKWTGDGFLAWFETKLQRNLVTQVESLFRAIYYLTHVINVSQLDVTTTKKFRIRHGVAFEHDALITKITDSTGHQSSDLIGRSVVLAFRLSGIAAAFPGIVTQRELADAYAQVSPKYFALKRWQPSKDDQLKYFKGERWGTKSICVSVDKPRRKSTLRAVKNRAKRAIMRVEGTVPISESDKSLDFVRKFFTPLSEGPPWALNTLHECDKFMQEAVSVLKTALEVIDKLPNHDSAAPTIESTG